MGLWFILCSIVVGVAATNTGNNALYIVLAVMLSLLVVSGLVSRYNLKGLSFEVREPGEVFATLPFHLKVEARNRSRFLPRWLLVLSLTDKGQPLLVPHLPAKGKSTGFVETIFRRRGRHRISWIHAGSIFPVGFFHKGMRYRVDVDLLVYPELYPAAVSAPRRTGQSGDGTAEKVGWGHELHSLRAFRQGDDPRGIHWKQTARTGSMIYTERETEQGRRLSIVFDNGVGELDTEERRARFERLVSEAATAAVDYLDRGFEVELVTRDEVLPFAGGRYQRRTILETLALIEPVARDERPLTTTGGGGELRLALERGVA